MTETCEVAIVGGGVIGSGWAARFLLNGVDVRLFDPDPDAPAVVDVVLGHARRSMHRLSFAPLPPEGELRFVDTVEDAVAGADFVQESAPERMEVKRELLGVVIRMALRAVRHHRRQERRLVSVAVPDQLVMDLGMAVEALRPLLRDVRLVVTRHQVD